MQADAEEFTEFVRVRMDRWRRVAYLLSRDWHTADDLVSTMVGKLYRDWRRIRRMERLDGYANRTLTRVWLDETRRPWRREHSAQTLPEPAVEGTDPVDDRDTLWRLLGTLGKRQRAVLILRFYLDLSVEETADALRITTGTVKSQSARGLKALRVLAKDLTR